MLFRVLRKGEYIRLDQDRITVLGINAGKDCALGIQEGIHYREGSYKNGSVINIGKAKITIILKDLRRKIYFLIEAPQEVLIEQVNRNYLNEDQCNATNG